MSEIEKNEIEKLLQENMEEYESASRQALKYLEENRAELEARYEYAEYLELPVKKDQIFFLWEDTGAGWEIPRKMLEYVQKTYGKKYTCICYFRGGVRLLPGGCVSVKPDTPAYWEALACSGYIISSARMPVSFVKRKEQIYFHTMSGACGQDSTDTVEWISDTAREMLKTDYVYAPSEKEARYAWLEKTRLGSVYDGCVLSGENTEEAAGEMAQRILGEEEKNPGGAVETFSMRNPEKKKILVLTSWKADREQKIVVRRLLKEIDPKRFDVAVLSAWANEPGLLKDFETKIPEHMAKLMSHGRMTVSEQECRNYRILEKHPDICVKYGEVRRYVNGLMDREWGRTLGNNSWDVCLLLGSMGYLQYYMAARAQAKKKILVDLDFLPYIREKNPAAWRMGATVFDRIYAPVGCADLGDYGMENRLRIMRLPVTGAEKPVDEPETVLYQEKTYLICDKWKTAEGRTGIKLVLLPEKGSILVNADLLPDEGRKEAIRVLGEKHGIYLIGANAKSYAAFLSEAVVLDEFVRQGLYLLPAAWNFFGMFEGYEGDDRLEADVMKEICRKYGVKCL